MRADFSSLFWLGVCLLAPQAFTSEHWIVRIYKVKDLANRA